MTAVLCLPPTAVPAPPGAREPFAAPLPVDCDWCGGDGWEPREESIRCLACNGSGVEPAAFELPRTRAYGLRRVRYEPACESSGHANRLLIETAVKPTHRTTKTRYEVMEIETDWKGRGFLLAKVGGRPEHWNVFVGDKSVSCDCPGESYLASAKGNQRAFEGGEETYPTFGCKHCDSVCALLLGGWFNIYGEM